MTQTPFALELDERAMKVAPFAELLDRTAAAARAAWSRLFDVPQTAPKLLRGGDTPESGLSFALEL